MMGVSIWESMLCNDQIENDPSGGVCVLAQVMPIHRPINDCSLLTSTLLPGLISLGTTTEVGPKTKQEQLMETQLADADPMQTD